MRMNLIIHIFYYKVDFEHISFETESKCFYDRNAERPPCFPFRAFIPSAQSLHNAHLSSASLERLAERSKIHPRVRRSGLTVTPALIEYGACRKM